MEIILKGDSENIKEIKKLKCNFFHYDSDKSYLGRQKTLYEIMPLLNKNSILVFDDIQDNCFFHDLVFQEDFMIGTFLNLKENIADLFSITKVMKIFNYY